MYHPSGTVPQEKKNEVTWPLKKSSNCLLEKLVKRADPAIVVLRYIISDQASCRPSGIFFQL